MAKPLDELREIRREKLQKLRRSGIDPFPQPSLIQRESIQAARQKDLGQKTCIAGRIRAWRAHGGSTFVDLEDGSDRIQIFFSQSDLGEETYASLNLLDIGDFLQAQGDIFKTQAGELTIKVASYNILTKSLRSPPSTFYGLKDIEERYRQRYVDLLVNPESRRVFERRAGVVHELRRILTEEGFLEVETPILQPLYGGASARPFLVHHNALGTDFYLRISDELYLKRLVVGGFEKVFEIGKDFRNEGIDRQHNPEFTMCEFYWAYANYETLMEFSERMISAIVQRVTGSHKVDYQGQTVDFRPPWPRLSFAKVLLDSCGLDLEECLSEESVVDFIKEKKIEVDLHGVVGYAALLDALYKKVVRPTLKGPLFLVDHPWQMKPLAKRKEGNPSRAASFQLIVQGLELINAYNELNDPEEQRERWLKEAQLGSQGLAEHQVLDEDYLRALEYGLPPTAGWGLGIDRLVSLLTNSHNIKEVILFPTLRPKDSSDKIEPPVSPATCPLEPPGAFPGREQVLELVKKNLKNQNLFRHVLAVEAVMRALARRFGGNEELWGSLGLLHDADWELTKDNPNQHTRLTLAWLQEIDFSAGPLVQALKSHNRKHTQLGEIQSVMEWALETCDELTGFIVSVALVRPDKKLASVGVEHVLKKWKEKSFAAAVDRDQIAQCQEKLGVQLNDFIDLALSAMKSIAMELGL